MLRENNETSTAAVVIKGKKQMKYKYLILATLCSALTACNSGDDSFFNTSLSVIGPSGITINEVGDNDPKVTIIEATTSGAGCPNGTGDITLSEDKRTLSVLFAEYEAVAGSGTEEVAGGTAATTSRVPCNIAVSLHVPPGYQAFLIGADYRGAVSQPAGSLSQFNREYFFASARSPILTASWSGERDNVSIDISDDLYAETNTHHGAACGNDVILRSNTSLYIKVPSADAETALIQMDSLDYENQQNKTQFNYLFHYERCT